MRVRIEMFRTSIVDITGLSFLVLGYWMLLGYWIEICRTEIVVFSGLRYLGLG